MEHAEGMKVTASANRSRRTGFQIDWPYWPYFLSAMDAEKLLHVLKDLYLCNLQERAALEYCRTHVRRMMNHYPHFPQVSLPLLRLQTRAVLLIDYFFFGTFVCFLSPGSNPIFRFLAER